VVGDGGGGHRGSQLPSFPVAHPEIHSTFPRRKNSAVHCCIVARFSGGSSTMRTQGTDR
jgi:hypothetical protein